MESYAACHFAVIVVLNPAIAYLRCVDLFWGGTIGLLFWR